MVNLATKELNKIVELSRSINLVLSEIMVVGPDYRTHAEMTAMLDWCHDQIGSERWSYNTSRRDTAPGEARYATEFYFTDASVAMMFKLKFG